jgi:hypothetical protein
MMCETYGCTPATTAPIRDASLYAGITAHTVIVDGSCGRRSEGSEETSTGAV